MKTIFIEFFFVYLRAESHNEVATIILLFHQLRWNRMSAFPFLQPL